MLIKKQKEKKATKNKSVKNKAAISQLNQIKKEIKFSSSVCRSCHSLPAGSVEIAALLLVLVFALSAVLMTSIYALQLEKAHTEALERFILEG